MTAIFKRSLMPVLTAAFLLLPGVMARAADEGISVTGTATVKSKPTVVEISGSISGEGELANDASVKFHDAKKKAALAIDGLKNPDLTMESGGSDVGEAMDPMQQQRMMQGQGVGETPKVRVHISEKVTLKLKNVDKLEPEKLLETVLKLIDTGRDAGISVGGAAPQNYYQMQQEMQNGGGSGGQLVKFKISDTKELQNQAYKQAIADARSKAQRIADLSGVKLGKVLSVHDDGVSSGTDPQGNRVLDTQASSGTLGDIPLTVNLQVQFEIEK